MKKNIEYEGTVEYIKFPNKGYVKVEGEDELVLVKNTLPGQRVRFICKKVRSGKKEGLLSEVLKRSNIENSENFCPHFNECGGCSYQTMDYENQKKLKFDQVKALLDKVYANFPLTDCISSPCETAYRNKMEFSFGDEFKDGPLSLGLHKKNSFYDIVKTTDCKIVDEDFLLVLKSTLDFYSDKDVRFYHKMKHEGVLRHLLIRKSSINNELLVCLVTTTQNEAYVNEWKDCILKNTYMAKLAGIIHMKNDSLSDVVRADSYDILYGEDFFYEKLFDMKFKITPFSFFQTNSLGAQKLYSIARDYVGDVSGKTVFDLYSGTGTIAQVLAPVCKKVVGVEIVDEAVVAARENAMLNCLSNCEFISGDVLNVINEIEEKPDFIVLDPPREGVHPKALQKILSYGVKRIVYISCKPTSLARDLEEILANGYVPIDGKCVDMFPWTRGIETVVLFENKKYA